MEIRESNTLLLLSGCLTFSLVHCLALKLNIRYIMSQRQHSSFYFAKQVWQTVIHFQWTRKACPKITRKRILSKIEFNQHMNGCSLDHTRLFILFHLTIFTHLMWNDFFALHYAWMNVHLVMNFCWLFLQINYPRK